MARMWLLDLDQRWLWRLPLMSITGGLDVSNPADVIMAAIHSAFDSYPKEGDPDWRSPSWIMPEECAHLTGVIMRELDAQGFQIVKKPPDALPPRS
jgi:hypothetical protein